MEKNNEALIPESFDKPLTEQPDATKCKTCGEEMEQPIFAKVTLANSTEEYHACPKCLSKLDKVKQPKPIEFDDPLSSEEADTPIPTDEKHQPKITEDTNCPYQFGYLRKHQRSLPIPEECMICKKMIECRI